ncbi:glycosyltransferase family 15 protein [Rhodotorula graminis WP1]|uniref:Glycosyltransferase family 15 protein n=1 Tax=Rhodotorula graminis (strain WP1) TaxID=578459 RepID=A0A0P9GY52_RHOGW|nr:glycosyltransferase family 15 protein [Rhodotorula graminis WP1]KPV72346.1 glycosyltransferase family 15 protein [Rhodotorula graminis WP1]
MRSATARVPPDLTLPTRLRPVSGCADTRHTTLEPREKAAIVVLVRERDLADLVPTLANFEQRFNSRFRYPYVFLASPDEGALSGAFRGEVERALPEGAHTRWGVVADEHWRIPPHLDPDAVRRGSAEQEHRGVQYAGREAYHHMCRWYAGLWVRHDLLDDYDWFWRLEPGVRFFCTVTYDPFRLLALHNKVYGFVMTVVENLNTVPSLFSAVKRYLERRGLEPEGALWRFLTRRGEDGDEQFSGCHFWTNMEIGDLRFFRSEAYQDFFRALDDDGGFYTERWGDAPVRALALGALASIDQVHYFEDLGYQHDWFFHCPARSTSRVGLRLDGDKGDGVVGCECECPREGELQGRKKGQETLDMDKDWRFSCLEQWKAAERSSRGT